MDNDTSREIYVTPAIHHEDQKTLEKLTENRHWDFAQFKSILVALGLLGNGISIPAPNRTEKCNKKQRGGIFPINSGGYGYEIDSYGKDYSGYQQIRSD